MAEQDVEAAKLKSAHQSKMLELAPSILMPLIAMHALDQWGMCESCSLVTSKHDDVIWPCPTIEEIVELVGILHRGDTHLLPMGSAPREAASAEGKVEITTVEGDRIAVAPLFREQVAVGINGDYITITKDEAKEIAIALAKAS